MSGTESLRQVGGLQMLVNNLTAIKIEIQYVKAIPESAIAVGNLNPHFDGYGLWPLVMSAMQGLDVSQAMGNVYLVPAQPPYVAILQQ